jgi:hypothetical protein
MERLWSQASATDGNRSQIRPPASATAPASSSASTPSCSPTANRVRSPTSSASRVRDLLERLELPEPWTSTVAASLQLIDELDHQIGDCERDLHRLGAEPRQQQPSRRDVSPEADSSCPVLLQLGIFRSGVRRSKLTLR